MRPYWKLSSMWDAPSSERYDRHEVSDTDQMLDKVEACRPWRGEHWSLDSSRRSKLEDFPMSALPIMSEKAVLCLRDLLGGNGEFVPVTLMFRNKNLIDQYYLYNCLKKHDAIDHRKTTRDMLYSDGQLKAGSPIYYAFGKVPKDINAFRCRQTPIDLIVSNRVAEELIKSTLTGWMLSPRGVQTGGRTLVSSRRAI